LQDILPAGAEIIQVCTVRDWIVILYDINDDGIKGCIDIWNPNTGVKETKKNSGPSWKDNGVEYISTIARWEDSDNVKLYVADGVNTLRMFNITPVTDTTTANENGITTGNADPINFGGFGSLVKIQGSLKPAIVQYAYILYTKYKGQSNVSPSSKPISLYSTKNNIDEGTMTGLTDCGVHVTINECKTGSYDKIKLYRITYYEQG
jgi:hypothetical protein